MPEHESPAAALARKRWKGKSKAERSEHMRMMVQKRWKKAKEEGKEEKRP